jgi:two-component system OmpR family sensor kinase
MFIKSIRWRLQLWLAALLVCVLTGFGVTAYQLQRISLLKEIDAELERRVAVISRAVRGGGPPRPGFGPLPPKPQEFDKGERQPSPPPERLKPPPSRGEPKGPFGPRDFEITPEIASLFDSSETKAFYFIVWSRDGDLFKRSSNAPTDMSLPVRLDNTDTRTYAHTRNEYREAFHFTELADCVLVGRSISADLEALRRFKWWLLAAGAVVLAFAFGGGWWLTSRAIRPIDDISAAATRISAGNLAERINVAETDSELGRLAGVLNSTFARLEAAFARQRQFTADASHELRTPLAVIIAEAQTALARERSAMEYQESIGVCLDAAQQMRGLTESLLQLARFDAGQEVTQRSPVDLAKSARVCVGRIAPLAEERSVKIHCDLGRAKIFGEPDRLGQLITNLLTNAIYYNKPNGKIVISTRSENSSAVLTLTDSGAGIAAEDLPHVFERFYRADKSRSRAEGHSGLGLAICKAIVDSHGGSIDVVSRPGAGTTFTVRLPTLTAD